MWKVTIFIITLCIGLQLTSAQDESPITVQEYLSINSDITEQPAQVIENTGYKTL